MLGCPGFWWSSAQIFDFSPEMGFLVALNWEFLDIFVLLSLWPAGPIRSDVLKTPTHRSSEKKNFQFSSIFDQQNRLRPLWNYDKASQSQTVGQGQQHKNRSKCYRSIDRPSYNTWLYFIIFFRCVQVGVQVGKRCAIYKRICWSLNIIF